jgi:hypothetical protein
MTSKKVENDNIEKYVKDLSQISKDPTKLGADKFSLPKDIVHDVLVMDKVGNISFLEFVGLFLNMLL